MENLINSEDFKEFMEEVEILNENSAKKTDVGDNNDSEQYFAVESSNEEDKVVTKGLKLKTSTRDRLNKLQTMFGDAETTILELLKTYETFNVAENDKLVDRKAEIDRFNYLASSLVEAYVNSLDMAKHIEDKFSDKITKEVKKKDEIIASLIEEKNALSKSLKEEADRVITYKAETEGIKESYSTLNKAFSAVESDLKIKDELIKNQQQYIESLNEKVEEGKEMKSSYEALLAKFKALEEEVSNNKLTVQMLDTTNEKLAAANDLSNELKEEIKSLKADKDALNLKIQEVITSKSEEVLKLQFNYEEKMALERDKNSKSTEALKDEIMSLRNQVMEEREVISDLKLKLAKFNQNA